jgi:lipoprotein-releasing system ATP-binding protein
MNKVNQEQNILTTLKLENVNKYYKNTNNDKHIILSNINFEINKQQTVALIGPSGSGKSSFLNTCGLLDNNFTGNITINNIKIHQNQDIQLTEIRKNYIGFIFQFHHLLQDLTVLENIIIKSLLLNINKKDAIENALDLLKKVGLSNKQNVYPSYLSGGEKQRVAIVRALINKPLILIADEPTGNLDKKNAHLIFDLILQLTQDSNISTIIATHDLDLSKQIKIHYKIDNKELIKE